LKLFFGKDKNEKRWVNGLEKPEVGTIKQNIKMIKENLDDF
jgi:vacuolar-type H+-ATPase subunit D/Vma8